LSGAVTATVLVVEFIKEIKCLKALPTRWLVFIVAEIIVIFTSIAKGELIVVNLPLYFLNGLLITTSAMGSWQIISDSLRSPKIKGVKEKAKGL
jgi:hypothetical protein